MRKLLLLVVVLLHFSLLPASADDQVADLVATESSLDVLIDLPPDLPAGYHTAVVQVTDPETQEVTDEDLNFCKDKSGEIHWDNICPDLDIVVDPETLEAVTDVESLPVYNPVTEPEKTAQTQVGGFAALSVLSAGGAAAGAALGGGGLSGGGSSGGGGSGGGGSGGGGSGGGSGEGAPGKGGSSASRGAARREEHGGLETEEALHSAHAKQNNEFGMSLDEISNMGIGDRSITWRAPLTPLFDSAIISASIGTARFSPLLAKIFMDSSYLRAIFGSLAAFSIPTGIFLGIQALLSSNFQPMAPSWQVFAALAILSLFEAIGGLVAVTIFAVGVLASGNANSLSAVLTVLAISAICISPSLLAGSFRPFRRKVEAGEHFWERISDYLLAAILTYWTFVGFINSLNVIAAKQLAITGRASEVGLVIGVGVIARMIVEDCATYLYPIRITKSVVELPKPSKRQQYISNILKALVFAVVMEAFIGVSIPLVIGTILFLAPNILKLAFGHVIPKSRLLHFALPKGGVRIVAMTILGTIFAKFAERIFTEPETFLNWGFVLLSIPGFLIAVLGLLSDDKNAGSLRNHKLGAWVYRLGGLAVFYLIIQIAIGKDVIKVIAAAFGFDHGDSGH
jgi:hypothetical protein